MLHLGKRNDTVTMAAKKESTSYKDILKDMKGGQYAPVYVLAGDETYFIDLLVDYITANALPEDQRDFNQTIVYGPDVTATQVVELARRFPMMSDRQVVVVKEAQAVRDMEPIIKYLEKGGNPTTVLVFSLRYGKQERKKKAFSDLVTQVQAVGGVVFVSDRLYDSELIKFMEEYLKGKKVEIDNKSTQMLAEYIGSDLHRLTSELDKIIISLPENKLKISPDIVEREVGVSKDFNGYELLRAISNRDVRKANIIAKYFDKNNKAGSIHALNPMLFNFFQSLMILHYSPNKNDDAALMRAGVGKTFYALREIKQAARIYSPMKTLQIISKIREMDAKSKGLDNSNTPPGELLQELIFFILH